MQKNSKHRRAKKVEMIATGENLTSQAGLVLIIHYLQRVGLEEVCRQVVPHKRSENAQYQLSEVVFVTMIGLLGGPTSMAKGAVNKS